jgi:hypothetical protein
VKPTRVAVVHALWRDADLEYLLHAGQVGVLLAFASSSSRRFVVECARRWGKSWFACVLAVMYALQRPGAQIRYAAPTQRMVRKIITPLMRDILEDCPEEMRATWNSQEGVWRFPNGSEIHVAGCDNGGADALRGTSTDLAIVDEAGFVDDLEYLVQSVLLPQLLTVDGRMLLISTPSVSPDHAWTHYCEEAEKADSYYHATIYDAPHISAEQREEFFREAGGEHTVAARRELLAERVVDETRAVVPEFAPLEKELVREWPRPEYFNTFVSGDIGFVDLAVFALGYVDFHAAKLVVEDEVSMQRSKSTDINVAVARKERALWGTQRPKLRVIDAAAITVADMDERVNVETGERATKDDRGTDVHAMDWQLAQKDEADAALNALRLAIGERRVIINPRCKTIVAHLRGGIWNKSRTSYERVERGGVRHHFDGIDAVKYLVRHADMRANPFPMQWQRPGVSLDTHMLIPASRPQERALSSLFRRPTR